MSQITICDQCDNPIEGEPYATMALPGEEDWVVMDVCSKSCVYDLFRLGDDIDEEGEISRVADYDDQLPLFPEPEMDEEEETSLKPVKAPSTTSDRNSAGPPEARTGRITATA